LVASSSVKAKTPACVVCTHKREYLILREIINNKFRERERECGCGEKRRQKRSEG
jgi:hypothetical protein